MRDSLSRRLAGLLGVEVPHTPGRKDSQQGPLLFSTHFPSASESPPLPILGTFWFGGVWGWGSVYTSHCPFSLLPSLLVEVQAWPKGQQDLQRQVGGPFCKDSSAEKLVTSQPLTRSSPHTLQSLSSFWLLSSLLAKRKSAFARTEQAAGPGRCG